MNSLLRQGFTLCQGGSSANLGKYINQSVNSFFPIFIIKGISASVDYFFVYRGSKQVF